MKNIPPFSEDLIKELDKQYPPVRPKDDISDRELWGKIYQRRLVDSLLARAKINPNESESDK